MRTRAVVLAAMLLPAVALYGGWATITIEDLPDHAVAGEPLRLAFTVRQHGRRPLDDLRPEIEARRGEHRLRVHARREPGMPAGQYVGTVVLDQGDWTITVQSGFGKSRLVLLPIAVLSPTAERPRPLADAERGRRLFVAKGCATCHVHRDASAGDFAVAVGPELTDRRYAADYLARFLADPTIAGTSSEEQVMPNLDLDRAEIEALVAFINTERQAVSSER